MQTQTQASMLQMELQTLEEIVTTLQVRHFFQHENIPARPASGWSVVRIYPRVRRPMGPS
eukprot:903359-Prorocentrum_minimum.AAC.1